MKLKGGARPRRYESIARRYDLGRNYSSQWGDTCDAFSTVAIRILDAYHTLINITKLVVADYQSLIVSYCLPLVHISERWRVWTVLSFTLEMDCTALTNAKVALYVDESQLCIQAGWRRACDTRKGQLFLNEYRLFITLISRSPSLRYVWVEILFEFPFIPHLPPVGGWDNVLLTAQFVN